VTCGLYLRPVSRIRARLPCAQRCQGHDSDLLANAHSSCAYPAPPFCLGRLLSASQGRTWLNRAGRGFPKSGDQGRRTHSPGPPQFAFSSRLRRAFKPPAPTLRRAESVIAHREQHPSVCAITWFAQRATSRNGGRQPMRSSRTHLIAAEMADRHSPWQRTETGWWSRLDLNHRPLPL